MSTPLCGGAFSDVRAVMGGRSYLVLSVVSGVRRRRAAGTRVRLIADALRHNDLTRPPLIWQNDCIVGIYSAFILSGGVELGC